MKQKKIHNSFEKKKQIEKREPTKKQLYHQKRKNPNAKNKKGSSTVAFAADSS